MAMAEAVRVAGIGFGPANVALAIAFEEARMDGPLGSGDEVVFFERQARFGWHRGLLIPDATMQVHFLKDLVTMRNPTSAYSYISYLHACDRLAEFINGKHVFPLRIEFHDYLEWVARQFDNRVSYGSDVIAVRPVMQDGSIEQLDVVVRGTGGDVVRRARNVVISTGLTPSLPDGVELSERGWHSAELLDRVPASEPRFLRRVAVVGGGQSAAETVKFLHDSLPDAEIYAIFARHGYSIADDSPFANGIFDPRSVDSFFIAPDDVKAMLLKYHSNTNYSVVDVGLADELYRRVYGESLTGRRRLTMLNTSRLRSVRESSDRVRLDVEYLPTGEVRTLDVDAVIYATGYRPTDPVPLLGDLAAECKRDGHGRLAVARDYRVVTSGLVRCGIYLHGSSVEHSHGLASGLLSTAAVRAGEIANSIASAKD